MQENNWTAADIGLLGLKLHTYLIQMLIAKGVATTAEVQNLVDQLQTDLERAEGDAGARALARRVLKDIPGITTR